MPARIVIRGRAYYTSSDFTRTARQQRRALDGLEAFTPKTEPIPPDHPHAPFRIGQPYFDREEGVEYRVVPARILDPALGWGTAAYWITRWKCVPEFIQHVCQRGWLDAALSPDSPTRRYRCRDEARVLEYMTANPRYRIEHREERRASKRRRK